VLDGIASDVGLVPNLAASIAESPTLLAAFDGMRRAIAAGPLDPVLREVAGLAVGVAVDGAYGVAFHSTMLAGLGEDEASIEAMRSGAGPKDGTGRCGAVYALAQAIVRDRGKVDEAVLERARLAGLTPAEILDVLAECAFASLVGLIDNLAGRVALDPFVAPRAWS
jgi:alkylhydroperoxidase family enzyme